MPKMTAEEKRKTLKIEQIREAVAALSREQRQMMYRLLKAANAKEKPTEVRK